MGTETRHILLVEDERGDALLLQRALKRSGHAVTVETLDSGAAAVDYMFQRGAYAGSPRPDLVLLDLHLVGTDGLTVLRTIKQEPALRAVPVVILSALEHPGALQEAYAAGANVVVPKSAGLTRIAQEISRFWLTVSRAPRSRG